MFTVNAHAGTSRGGPLAPAAVDRRAPGLHEITLLAVRLLTAPGATP
ncbi:hypothetical protein AB0E04_39955 [Streptomyces sp. NPDC048251]